MRPSREYMEQLRQSKMALPPLSELAARVRDGEDSREVALSYGIEYQGFLNRMRAAGYRGDTGEAERDARLREMRTALADAVRSWFEPWMEDAACASIGGDLWFPDKGGTGTQEFHEAKRICMGCDVRDECAGYALRNGERFGVWAGFPARQLRKQWEGAA